MIMQSTDLRAATKLDIPAVNRILNHRDVRPSIGLAGAGEIDVSATFGEYVILLFSRSLFLVESIDAFSVEVHSAVVPEDRGKCAIDAARLAIERTLLNTPITMVFTKNQNVDKHTSMFAIQCGFHRIRMTETTTYWAMSLEDWLASKDPAKLAGEIEAGGQVTKFQYAYQHLAHLFQPCPQPSPQSQPAAQ